MFLSKDVALIFEQATELININIDAALEEFNDGINRAKECMMKILTLGKIKNNLWFDSECRGKRGKVRQALRKLIKCSTKTEANELRTIYRGT